MKTSHLAYTALIVIMSFSLASHAAETPKAPPAKGDHAGMGKMTDAQLEQHLKAKQESQLKIHELSNQILAEQDPAKKEQLKAQQLELMKAEHMQRMEHHQGMMKMHKM